MNRHRFAIAITLAAIAVSGLGACGGDDTRERVREQGTQIEQDAAALRERAAKVTEDAKAGKDTREAQEELEKDVEAIGNDTKAVADEVLDDVKDKTPDGATKKAIEDVQDKIQPVPTP